MPVQQVVDGGTAKLMPDVDRPRAWLLTIDGAAQSYVDLDDPRHLEFEYTRRLGHVVDLVAEPARPLRVVHLGGGALTLARYVAVTRPRARQWVAEADRRLLTLVRDRLPLPPGTALEVLATDARQALGDLDEHGADLVIADVFGGSRTPAHLTSVEFLREVRRVVAPGGYYAANLADGAPWSFLRSQLASCAVVFGERSLVAEPAMLHGRRFGNAVLLAGRTEPPLASLARRVAADPFPARVLHGPPLDAFVGAADPVWDRSAVASPEPPAGAFDVV